MKNTLLAFIAILAGTTGFAADLIVQDGGPVSTYASIGAAVTASVDGDRIIINNRLDGLPWTENITINKSLSFVSGVDNQRFLVAGDYTVVHAPNRVVNIVGMENTVGDIAAQADGSTAEAIVNLNWCNIIDGDVSFNYNYFTLNIGSSIIIGSVSYFKGLIAGNQFGGNLTLYESNLSPSNDTLFIVGNKGIRSLTLSSDDYYFYVANNNSSSSGIASGLYLNKSKSGASINIIKNNSIYGNGNGQAGIKVNGSDGNINIFNNLITGNNGTDYGIYKGASVNGIITASYNAINTSFDSDYFGLVNDGTNYNYSGTPVTADMGVPGVLEYDLDLTRNDVGVLGGSYTQDNFHPIDGPSSKVFFLKMPRQIFIAQPNAVTGYSFDR